MVNAEKLLPEDKLWQGYPKINKAIDNANEALSTSIHAFGQAGGAVETANQAKEMSELTQNQLDTIIIENGTSDAEVLQARGGFPLLYQRLNDFDTTINEVITKAGMVVSVREKPYNAKGDGITNDTAAIQNAINDVIASGGGKVIIPDGIYLVDNILITFMNGYTDMSIHLSVEGTGNSLLLSNPVGTDYTLKIQGDLTTNTFMRSIKIKNLKIVGNKTVNASGNSQRINRQGVLVRQSQDVYFEDVWISQFSQEGLKLHDCYDSPYVNVQIFNCGMGNADNTFKAGLTLTGSLDNTNACYFFGLHIEFCPILIVMDHGARHNEFVACKFEQGQVNPNYSTQAPIAIADVLENSFNSCFFVLNTEDGLNGSNYFIYSNDASYGSTQNQKRTTFVNCQFGTRTGYAAKWFRGHHTSFDNCIFNGTKGELPFAFLNNNSFTDNQITISTNTTGCYSLEGSRNNIRNNRIKYTTSAPTSGAFIKFVYGIQKNIVEDNIIEGNYYTPYEIDANFNSYLGDNIVTNKFNKYKEDTADTSPNLLWGANVISLNYTGVASIATFQFGYNGQEIVLIARNGNATIVHDTSKIVLKSGANKTMSTNQTMKLVNANGIWYEI